MDIDIKLNHQQKVAAQHAGSAQNLLIVAEVGCGKTLTTIARASYLIRSGADALVLIIKHFFVKWRR